jgi:IS605 OrfB family transposase
VHLAAQLKLHPSPEQADALRRTRERANAACNYISECAWESKTFRQFDLHKLCYREVRERFGLAAQVTVRCISKVADGYKLDRNRQRRFHPLGSIAYDARILAYHVTESTASVWSLDGRLLICFACGERQRELLVNQKGESDLVFRRGHWYLLATCAVPDAKPASGPAMGVDLGIRNTAATSHGTLYSGAARQQFKEKRHKVRASLQSRNNRRARKALRKQSGRERRRITWENHNLSKAIVAEAEGTQCGTIRMERLAGIRQRCKIWNKHSNRMVAGWSFAQLRAFIAYKATRSGIKIECVEPAYTSQTCATCGTLGVRRGDVFACTTCGKVHADSNAAVNIARGGVAQGAKHRARKPARMTARCESVSHIVKSRRL